ncbi:hypothetical protein CFR78_05155 [Komagataeibacter rhaeticus]|uniref:DUF4112 domain-containing protein n=1 Tax=Komagataeibacter rhaeticus TaxID=215221 RepID=A0A181C9Q7_9PROT|nr:DUF4112 domain-containing protein [Komagataeibacter rhaeticus]ATU74364.1 DUF4112 domain-containing protein [Komagataeibacter xylinus]KDU96287.1 hypothetical protein GLUCORHAEAF1_03215 [Komagataeibacter rhaeticus AF1]MBL7240727.1 DUF4112 domain-containing protein [Komagataeibacter rhaeticus]PYD54447.1 hypothetical protein CFR78_05155 [Komagataeibacter rhaeticus]QIP35145.1 DUF4112 domain-containing protein [Komagataeibacter rhaeticus]
MNTLAPSAAMPADIRQEMARLRRLATLLDAAFRIPGTRARWGLDTLVGLLPVGGTAVMLVPSLYIIWKGWRLGASRAVLSRMMANVLVETAADLVPVVGDVFDTAFKADLRNVALLERYFGMTVP